MLRNLDITKESFETSNLLVDRTSVKINITGNIVLNSQRYGIGVFGANNNRFINNTSKGSLLSDYYNEGSKHNVFVGNTFEKGDNLIPEILSVLIILSGIISLGLVVEYKRYQKETEDQLIHKTFVHYLKGEIKRTKKK